MPLKCSLLYKLYLQPSGKKEKNGEEPHTSISFEEQASIVFNVKVEMHPSFISDNEQIKWMKLFFSFSSSAINLADSLITKFLSGSSFSNLASQ